MNLSHSDRAQVLVEALPYIQRYYPSYLCHVYFQKYEWLYLIEKEKRQICNQHPENVQLFDSLHQSNS